MSCEPLRHALGLLHMRGAAVITGTIAVTVLRDTEGASGWPRASTLRFDPDFPLVVTFLFGGCKASDGGDSPAWELERSLLADGGGIADVKVTRGEHKVHLVLEPPAGRAEFEFSVAALDVFLARTYELVPLGEEFTEPALDSLIAQLVGGS